MVLIGYNSFMKQTHILTFLIPIFFTACSNSAFEQSNTESQSDAIVIYDHLSKVRCDQMYNNYNYISSLENVTYLDYIYNESKVCEDYNRTASETVPEACIMIDSGDGYWAACVLSMDKGKNSDEELIELITSMSY